MATSVHHLEDVASTIIKPQHLLSTIALKSGVAPVAHAAPAGVSLSAAITDTPSDPTLAALWNIIKSATVPDINSFKQYLTQQLSVPQNDLNIANQKYNAVKSTYPWNTLTEQETISITIYTGNSIYGGMNAAIRNFNPSNPAPVQKYATVARAITDGLAKLPNFAGNPIYRGFNSGSDILNTYQVGAAVAWLAFSSCSTNFNTADGFGNVVLTISHKSGKDIRQVSMYNEGEILLGMLTLVSVTYAQPGGANTLIHVTEIDVPTGPTTPPPSSGKNLLWVDDIPSNNTTYVQTAQSKGVNVIQLKSTAEALVYVQSYQYLLQQGLSQFRIVTDGGRTEQNGAGGLTYYPTAYRSLVEVLRGTFNYQQTIAIFTAPGNVIPDLQSLNLAYYTDGKIFDWVAW